MNTSPANLVWVVVSSLPSGALRAGGLLVNVYVLPKDFSIVIHRKWIKMLYSRTTLTRECYVWGNDENTLSSSNRLSLRVQLLAPPADFDLPPEVISRLLK